MKRLIINLLLLVALSAGQVIRLPSSYNNGVKWEFGADIFRGEQLARSNVGQDAPVVPIVYKKEPLGPAARKEPAAATIYKRVPDVYKTRSVVPAVYQKERSVPSVREQQQQQQPAVFKAQPVASNIYRIEPTARNVYKQQPAVPIVRKTHPVVSNIYKSQPIRPTGHYPSQSLHHFVVPKVLPADSRPKTQQHAWNYQYNPHRSSIGGNVHAVPRN